MSYKSLTLATIGVIMGVLLMVAGSLFETNLFGNYQVKQAAISGNVTHIALVSLVSE